MLRFEVVGESMTPAFRAGDWLVADRLAYRSRAPRPGNVVLLPDPREPGRLLLKRVACVEANGDLTVLGDNPAESTDSRHFGPVPRSSVVARVRARYWPGPRVF
jgi:nickel-type superoxide dismutase maturation protease